MTLECFRPSLQALLVPFINNASNILSDLQDNKYVVRRAFHNPT